MGLAIHSTKTEEPSQIKFHVFKKRVSTTCKQFQGRVVSRFHVWSREDRPLVEKITLKFDRTLLFSKKKKQQDQRKLEIFRFFSKAPSNQVLKNNYKGSLDWTRGRFSGTAIAITVENGVIVEKVFLTPKGNRISVKRAELGIFTKLMTFFTQNEPLRG
tara:strand:- start:880 stop:1356 length:477 start_codon:yes stop_codon:yes gene_type:complete